MKIILTRHGETEENKLGIIQGHLPGKLSKEGIDQAKKLAKRLSKEHIDYIYSSDLARAADTAKEIAKYHPKVPITLTKELREKFLGSFQGKTREEIGWDQPNGHISDDGETRKEMYGRAKGFLEQLMKDHMKDTVLLVGHNGINMAIVSAIKGDGPEGISKVGPTKNTSISIIDINKDKKYKIHLFDCDEHLK